MLAIGTVLVAVVLVASLTTNHSVHTVNSKCGAYRNDKTLRIGSTDIQAELAQSTAERDMGLGGRPCIEQNQGMLFIFKQPGHYSFWMKDMRFPIDIVWIGADHKVAGLETNVQPSTYPDRFINKQNLAQYVLELQADRANSLKIDIGTPVSF